MFVAIDFETTYTKERDVTRLGVARYVEHPETEAYLVSVYREDGFTFVGHPSEAPWWELDGHHWLSHNAAFDATVFVELKRRGIVHEDIAPCEWDCTANMAAFLNCKRDLKSAAKILLGEEIGKETRDAMKGKTWANMTPEFREEAKAYALKDAELCIRLWAEHSHLWPEKERALSRHTMLMCMRGIRVNMEKVEEWHRVTTRALAVYEAQIPWAGTVDAKGKPVAILSPHALKRHCIANNIPPPSTTADDSPIFDLWMFEWGPRAPFVEAVKNYRYVNRVRDLLQSFKDFVSADGRLRYSLKYFGAHTGRWSGGGGINLQNFPRDPLCFDENYNFVWDDEVLGKASKRAKHVVDLRNLFVADPGKKFLIGDFRQIEAVVAMWMAQDWEQLAYIAQGMDSYEAHARKSMGYADPRPLADYVKAEDCPQANRTLRQFAKCRRLGLQYGLGPVKFVTIVRQWARLTITRAEATRIVADFRAKEKGIVEQWNALERALRIHIAQGVTEPFEVELPSWRSLKYYDVTRKEGNSGYPVRGSSHTKLYGGFLFQNCLAGDTEVRTKRGWVKLLDVRPDDKLWDGVEWVSHEGVVCKGEQEVINYCDVVLTPDHKILTPTGMVAASEAHPKDAMLCGGQNPWCMWPTRPLDGRVQVYDIINAGPRHRFQVRGKAEIELIVSNCDQAISRDALGDKTLLAEAELGEVMLHIHDELVVQVDADVPVSALRELMERPLEWAPDMPVRADVHESFYYRKF